MLTKRQQTNSENDYDYELLRRLCVACKTTSRLRTLSSSELWWPAADDGPSPPASEWRAKYLLKTETQPVNASFRAEIVQWPYRKKGFTSWKIKNKCHRLYISYAWIKRRQAMIHTWPWCLLRHNELIKVLTCPTVYQTEYQKNLFKRRKNLISDPYMPTCWQSKQARWKERENSWFLCLACSIPNMGVCPVCWMHISASAFWCAAYKYYRTHDSVSQAVVWGS